MVAPHIVQARLAKIFIGSGFGLYAAYLDHKPGEMLRDIEDQLALSETEATVNVIRLFKALGGGWEAFE